jgi:putative methyltransferase
MNQYDNFDIIDCCAAPGNKTLQLAEYLGDKGTVYAFDKDPKRAELLKKRIQYHGMGNIKVFNQDFLTTDPHSPQFKNVRMILADPSCSGSGMLTNLERDSNTEFNTTQSLTEYE